MEMKIIQGYLELNNFNYIGGVNNFNLLKELVNNFSGEDWKVDTCRQDAHQAHLDTMSVIAKKADLHYRGIKNEYTTRLFDDVIKLLEIDLQIVNLLFAKLPSKKIIPNHVDTGYMLTVCKRYHVPIITNNNVIFTVNGESINMKEGCMYEINNNAEHSVINNGESDRVHLIFDIMDDL